jgi:large subunit ribosomal protein L2
MAVKYIKPRSSGRRTSILIDYKHTLTGDKAVKSLTKILHKQSGRNNRGVITTRHQGGGEKKKYRQIDFMRDIKDISATVKTLEYDPNRTALICLVAYANGERRYIIAPRDIKVGDKIVTAETADIKPGNCMRIKNIPEGTFIHCIEL